jgi:hypothetical protein
MRRGAKVPGRYCTGPHLAPSGRAAGGAAPHRVTIDPWREAFSAAMLRLS